MKCIIKYSVFDENLDQIDGEVWTKVAYCKLNRLINQLKMQLNG